MPQVVGKTVGKTGYGLMGLTWRASPQPEEESFKAMKASLEAGCNFWNAGEFYGTPQYNSLTLMEKYFTKYPEDAEKVVLSIKGGINLENFHPDGSPEGIRRSVDNCLKLLNGKKSIDVFECARVDKTTPLEITLKTLEEEYVKTGKIGGIALSEVGLVSLQKAVKITKIVAVEVELSLWSLDPLSNGVAELCAKENIPIVAYSPIGRGILTGEIKSTADIPDDDLRKSLPRFSEENFPKNLELVKELEAIVKNREGITPAQLAIGWVRQLSEKDGNPVIIPIPGATKVDRVHENAKEVDLTTEDLEAIDAVLKSFKVEGGRYGGHLAAVMDG